MRYFLLPLLFFSLTASAQKTYTDSLKGFRTKYIKTHEVVRGDDRKLMQFFPVDPRYRVIAQFRKTDDSPWFLMPTSGPMKQSYRVYGTLSFRLKDTTVQLNVYQSRDLTQDEYKDYLFLPFTDATCGNESYGSGRYIDLKISDVKNNTVVLDFNKAYNPYCAYVSGRYNCPIPPKENQLPVAVRAGEKNYKGH